MASLNDAVQYAIRTLKTAGEFARKAYDMFYNPNPLDVQTEVYDENGNLIKAKIPNLAKWRDIVWKDAQSAMSKTVYVHPLEGSDNTGDGSQNAPFKSIEKAENSVPSGGNVDILLLSDYTLERDVLIVNRRVTIKSADPNNPVTIRNKETTITINGTTYRRVTHFTAAGSILLLKNVNLENVEMTQSYPTLAYGADFIDVLGSFIYIYKSNIRIGSDTWQSLCKVDNWDGQGGIIGIRESTITTGGGYVLHLLNNSTAMFSVYSTSINDSTKWAKGVIKDPNGTPRNVVSNLVL